MSVVERASKTWLIATLLLLASIVGAVVTIGDGLGKIMGYFCDPDPKLQGIDRAVELGYDSLLYCLAKTAPDEINFAPAPVEATTRSLMTELSINLDLGSFTCTGLNNDRDLTLRLRDAVERNHDGRFLKAFELGQWLASSQYAAYFEERRQDGRPCDQAEKANWSLASNFAQNAVLGGEEPGLEVDFKALDVKFTGSMKAASDRNASLTSPGTAHLAQTWLYYSYRNLVGALRQTPSKINRIAKR